MSIVKKSLKKELFGEEKLNGFMWWVG